ncbi:Golgi apyrase [Clydaea vesicula]|uniref:Golgi apyrase n=1 Tax=Clydaea vesicula TaxID=447962 RepID=A0AAD5U3M1_9FUNG|nr:Golgi apyrase [Clydaea vesicula]
MDFGQDHHASVKIKHLLTVFTFYIWGGRNGNGYRICLFTIVLSLSLIYLVSLLNQSKVNFNNNKMHLSRSGKKSNAGIHQSDFKINSELKDTQDLNVLNLNTTFKIHTYSQEEEEVNFISSEWVKHREFAIIIDAGSSGSRVLIYSWKNPEYTKYMLKKSIFDNNFVTKEEGNYILNSLPIMEPGDEYGEDWQFKEEPGISTFHSKPHEIGLHLKPLLDYAASKIPARKRSKTPIYLLATAGLRLISEESRTAILRNTCSYVRNHYDFDISGGCDQHFRMISGELEGIYGWVAVNYLMGGFDTRKKIDKHTFGFLDLGGASTQIAFEPTAEMSLEHESDLTTLKLRTIGGNDIHYKVFVSTFLGFGVNEARRRYLEILTNNLNDEVSRNETLFNSAFLSTHETSNTIKVLKLKEKFLRNENIYVDPCLPLALEREKDEILNVALVDDNIKKENKKIELIGIGNLEICLKILSPLLNKSLPCPENPCLFNGVHAPIEDFKKHKFFGISEYWYTPSDLFQLGGSYSYSKLFDATKKYCKTSWINLNEKFENGFWPHIHETSKLELVCFKSAWIMSLIHGGLGISKLDHEMDLNKEQTFSSNFQSINEIGKFQVSWTLGAVLFHASATTAKKLSNSNFDAEDENLTSVVVDRGGTGGGYELQDILSNNLRIGNMDSSGGVVMNRISSLANERGLQNSNFDLSVRSHSFSEFTSANNSTSSSSNNLSLKKNKWILDDGSRFT